VRSASTDVRAQGRLCRPVNRRQNRWVGVLPRSRRPPQFPNPGRVSAGVWLRPQAALGVAHLVIPESVSEIRCSEEDRIDDLRRRTRAVDDRRAEALISGCGTVIPSDRRR
jgi:hypothetical protein